MWLLSGPQEATVSVWLRSRTTGGLGMRAPLFMGEVTRCLP